MPSPFPGMDPYLEGSEWMSFHTQFAVEIARQLAPRLRPRYVARTPRRYIRVEVDATAADSRSPRVYPDIAIAESARPSSLPREPAGAAAVMPAPLQLPTVIPEAVPHVSVEVRSVSSRELVTAIEVLSPTNKRQSRGEYLRRRRRLLLSAAHLMEIDLLHEGERVPMQRPLPPAPYFVFLSRAQRRPITEVWPVPLGQPLPTVPVPLLAGDADVPLDLQAAFTGVYDGFAYDGDLDYSRPPETPLAPREAEWARERLRAWRAAPPGQ